MVWGGFKAEGKSPHPVFFFRIQTSFPICSILALTSLHSLFSLPFSLFPFLPHTAILPLRWGDVVFKALLASQPTVSKSLNHWMTELWVWVQARCVQAIQEQVAASEEDNKDTPHIRPSSFVLHYFKPNAAVNHWIAYISFLFLSTKCQMSEVS